MANVNATERCEGDSPATTMTASQSNHPSSVQPSGHHWQYDREADVFTCRVCNSTTFDPNAHGNPCCTLTVWRLARLAGVSDPDSQESPGATWLRRVLSSFEDLGAGDRDALHETADALVPVYTHERWQVFVDLAAYEAADDARRDGLVSADASMTESAGVALYVIAERLMSALIDQREEV